MAYLTPLSDFDLANPNSMVLPLEVILKEKSCFDAICAIPHEIDVSPENIAFNTMLSNAEAINKYLLLNRKELLALDEAKRSTLIDTFGRIKTLLRSQLQESFNNSCLSVETPTSMHGNANIHFRDSSFSRVMDGDSKIGHLSYISELGSAHTPSQSMDRKISDVPNGQPNKQGEMAPKMPMLMLGEAKLRKKEDAILFNETILNCISSTDIMIGQLKLMNELKLMYELRLTNELKKSKCVIL